MNFNEIRIKNFLTISEATLDLNSRGLLLIQGENLDDTSAGSNGAGKSSTVDAVFWCLYGATARGLTGDAVVNNTAKKDTSVAVIIEDGPLVYSVERYRKHSKHKNALRVTSKDLSTHAEVDLTKGTDKETQVVVNSIVGCGIDVFQGAIYAGQEKMPDLPGMTDKQLKLLLEEAAGTEVLARAYELARVEMNAAKGKQVEAETRINNMKGALVDHEARLVSDQTLHAEFEAGRKPRASLKLADVPGHNAAREAALKELAGFDEPALTDSLNKVDAKLMGLSEEREKLQALQRAENQASNAAVASRTKVESFKVTRVNLEAKVSNVEAMVGTPCASCGKTYATEDLGAARSAQQANLAAHIATGASIAAQVRVTQEALTSASNARIAFEATLTDPTALSTQKSDLQRDLQRVKELTNAITHYETQVANARAAAKGEMTAPNPYDKQIELVKGAIEATKVKITAAIKEFEDQVEEVELRNDAVAVFGPAGVRAHILDTITPFLNEQTREYLGALSDGNIHATWSTLTRTAKGELREKFNIEVVNDKGGDSFAAISGGEKRKVRLATMMALQDLVASRATKPINLFIADEIDHALDEAGLERLMGILERKARERGTAIVISHNSLSDWISNVITATKSGKCTTLSGSLTRVI